MTGKEGLNLLGRTTTVLLILLVATVFSGSIRPVAASQPGFMLDPNSISTLDITPETSPFTHTAQFAVGVLIFGVSQFDTIQNLYGFQFTLNFDPAKLTAQAPPPDPNLSSNCAAVPPVNCQARVQFGAQLQTTWAQTLAAGQAFTVINIDNAAGTVTAAYTLLSPQPARTVDDTNLLGRVYFEIDTAVADPGTQITLTNVILSNPQGQPITTTTELGQTLIIFGPVREIISNNPPSASFTFSPANPVPPDPSGTTTVTFLGTTSSDTEGPIANYFWDFGDGNGEQNLGPTPISQQFTGLTSRNVTLRVVDSQGATGLARDSTSVLVDDQPSHTYQTVIIDNPPSLSPITPQTVDEETVVTFTATATDPDTGQTITYSLQNAPAGTAINAATGIFTWTPSEAQGPNTFSFNILATDNLGASDAEAVTITVNEVNKAPVLTVPSAQTGTVGAQLTFTLTVSDPDLPANTVTFSVAGLPPGATFDAATGRFSWTPGSGQTGEFTVNFTATDNGSPSLSHTRTVMITVQEAPAISPLVWVAAGLLLLLVLGFLVWLIFSRRRKK